MSSFQVWIAFLFAFSLFTSCAIVYSYPTPTPHPAQHKPACYHRKTPPPAPLPPLPPSAFYFFSPPPPYYPKTPRSVGLGPLRVPPPRL
ncbi:hypothetical protein CR513_35585, partial [Mucuna pruriens]